MKLLKLSKGMFAKVDDDDYEKLKNYSFWVFKPTYTYYAASRMKTKKTYLLHRIIMNAKDGDIVDHMDRDGLNCQKENLRFTTKSLNNINSKNRINKKTSKFRGVYKIKGRDVFQARIQKDNKQISLGVYKTEEEAGKAYEEASKKYYGEYSKK